MHFDVQQQLLELGGPMWSIKGLGILCVLGLGSLFLKFDTTIFAIR